MKRLILTKTIGLILSLAILSLSLTSSIAQSSQPNILLIIADDMGIDVTNGYQQNAMMPVTPHLDSLQAAGLKFTNTWATPQCTPSRAAIISGKYGIKTGLMKPPGNLELTHESLFTKINTETNDAYAGAVIGKWHLSNPHDGMHPGTHGIDHYEGVISSSVNDYFDWEKTYDDGTTEQVMEYATTHFTDNAIDWVDAQTKPWFLWLAHIAPHSPFHDAPAALRTTDPTSPTRQYLGAIEAMDHEIGRLLDSMDEETRQNTVIIFLGDNGTPGARLQYFPQGHGKGSMYEGGLRVPMFISGKGITRAGESEDGLTHIADLYATILEIIGIQQPGGVYNSLNLKPALTTGNQINRPYNYTDYEDGNVLYWAIRNDQYKLIENENGDQEFYDLIADDKEETNLIGNLTNAQSAILMELEEEASVVRNNWSCQDGIQNGTESAIDACNDMCTGDNSTSFDLIACCQSPTEPSVFYEFVENGQRKIYANNFPDHDLCHTNNNDLEQKYHLYNIPQSPAIAGSITEVISGNGRPARFFGVAKNGVKFAPAPATPFIFLNPTTNEYNWDWVFEATNNLGAGQGSVSLDCATGHVGPQGYHYHGNMFEYVEGVTTDISTTSTPPSDPLHIGWASDGFPILYRFGPDENGNLKELLPSFQFKSGIRPGDGISAPCGAYNGKYTNDYEYISGKGDLDECNGVQRSITLPTSEGNESFDYFYVITADFPQISRCMVGTVSPSFENDATLLTGTDADNDGYLAEYDCNDNDASINPSATEIEGNDVDENCDGELSTATITYTPKDLGLRISPNPTSDVTRIACRQGCHMDVKIYSISGQFIKAYEGHDRVRLTRLQPGSYVAHIIVDSDKQASAKLTVQ